MGDLIDIPTGFSATEGIDLSGDGNRVILALKKKNGSENGAIASFDFKNNKWTQTIPLADTEIFTTYGVALRTTQDGNSVVVGNSDDLPAEETTVIVYHHMDNEWQVKGNEIPNVANDETSDGHVDITADGSRFVIGSVKSGPNDSKGCIKVYEFEIPSSIDDQTSLSETNIFPNPTNDFVNINWGTMLNNVVIQVLNSHGQILREQHLSGQTCQLELPKIPGLYFVNVLAENGTFQTFKVLKL